MVSGTDQRVAAPIPDNYVRKQLVLLTAVTFICHHYKLLALASCNPQFTLVLISDAICPTGRGMYLWSRMEKCYILSWFGGLQAQFCENIHGLLLLIPSNYYYCAMLQVSNTLEQ
jgi:hypothetical protein